MCLSDSEKLMLQNAVEQQEPLDQHFIDLAEKYGTQRFLRWVVEDIKKKESERHLKIYSYMVTFTLDPKKNADPEKAQAFIHLQAKRVALNIKKAWVSTEHHEDGRLHWHMYIQCTKALRSDAFKYYQTRFGNVDLSKSKYNSEADALSYITKETDPILLI